MQNNPTLRPFNANTIKILAAFFMVIDHIGLMFFPAVDAWRIVGRLSMPLFAFAIAEGCRYTKNKAKHFAWVFGAGVIFQFFYTAFSGDWYLNIFLTFSFSIVNIYALYAFKKRLFYRSKPLACIPALLLFIFTVGVTAAVCHIPQITVDYGFWGCMLPVFASIFDFRGIDAGDRCRALDCLPLRILCMGIGIVALTIANWDWNKLTVYALCALPILLLYNGEKGKYNLKYFFYIFYPLHLGVLGAIYLLVYML